MGGTPRRKRTGAGLTLHRAGLGELGPESASADVPTAGLSEYQPPGISSSQSLLYHELKSFMWHALHAALANVSRFVWKGNWRIAEVPISRNRSSNAFVSVLCVLAEDQDRSLMTDLCRRNHWEVFFATTREEAARALEKLKPQIILFDRDMAGQDWREFVIYFSAASPRACIILVSRVFDDYLWNELVSNGGYEVLRKPLREDEVSRTARMAWSYWSSASRPASTSKK